PAFPPSYPCHAAQLLRAAGIAGLQACGLLASLPAVAQTAAAPPAASRGPASVADLAEGLLDAVVNISTSQMVTGARGMTQPRTPEGVPFRELLDYFLDRQKRGGDRPRRVQSLGSGFVIDPAGIIFSYNHVFEEPDEIAANFNDGTRLIAKV